MTLETLQLSSILCNLEKKSFTIKVQKHFYVLYTFGVFLSISATLYTFCWSLPENILSITQLSVSLPRKYFHFNEWTFIFVLYKFIKHLCILIDIHLIARVSNHLDNGTFYSANIQTLTLLVQEGQ